MLAARRQGWLAQPCSSTASCDINVHPHFPQFSALGSLSAPHFEQIIK
jgi:hypothetical protein